MKKKTFSLLSKAKKHWKLIVLLVLVVAGTLLFLLSRQTNNKELVFQQPQYRDLTRTLDLSGTIDAKQKARLRFLAGGKIVYLGAQEGDWIKQWQTIATIDQRDLQKRLEKTLNYYMQQRWDWEELSDDVQDRTLDISEQRFVDKQQWSLDNTVIDVEIQDIAISQTVMSAPFTGVLVYSPVSVAHTQVTPNDYFELINPNSLVFRAEINEEDISLVSLGQQARIELDAYQNEELSSQLSYIAFQSSQTASGTVFTVEFPLINNQEEDQDKSVLEKYRLGMNGDAYLILEEKQNVLAIPMVATKLRNNQVLVEIKTANGELEEREIEVGLETEEWLEVLSGLSLDDWVYIPSN